MTEKKLEAEGLAMQADAITLDEHGRVVIVDEALLDEVSGALAVDPVGIKIKINLICPRNEECEINRCKPGGDGPAEPAPTQPETPGLG